MVRGTWILFWAVAIITIISVIFAADAAEAVSHDTWKKWQPVASCESGKRWAYNGSSGYDGGLQFSPSTWTAQTRGVKWAPAFAWQATAHQQVVIAEKLRRRHGLGQWPHCGKLYGS